jgi:uncharacterized membrane protein
MNAERSVFGVGLVAALVNLGRPGHYIHWGWFHISVANFVVILLMIAVFALAIAVPFVRVRHSEH